MAQKSTLGDTFWIIMRDMICFRRDAHGTYLRVRRDLAGVLREDLLLGTLVLRVLETWVLAWLLCLGISICIIQVLPEASFKTTLSSKMLATWYPAIVSPTATSFDSFVWGVLVVFPRRTSFFSCCCASSTATLCSPYMKQPCKTISDVGIRDSVPWLKLLFSEKRFFSTMIS